jgi:periodic tryptophan protein 1
MSSMITTSAWVPRGFAAPFPSKYNFDEAEFERIAELAKLQLDDANDDLQQARDGDDDGDDDGNDGDSKGAEGSAANGTSEATTAAQEDEEAEE